MSHYIISVGHTASGNIGCGAVDKLDESNCTREISPIVTQLLRDNGHQVTFLQVDKSNTYLYEDCHVRAQQANAVGADLFVEIHINAGGGTGSEVIVSPKTGDFARTVASRVTASIATSMGFPNRGVKENGLIVLNETNMPAILVECCFCDSSDAYIYDANKIAAAIVSGLLNTQIAAGKYKKGWNQDSTGWWYSADGTNYYTSKDGWKQIDNEWYIFDSQGYALQHKWFYDTSDKNWYYLNNDCKMVRSQWVLWNDLWYYMDEHGVMKHGCFFTDTNGKTYYLDEDGAMATGCVIESKKIGPDGAVIVDKKVTAPKKTSKKEDK
jgi:N-acetylmuramoyl-L-alanine amidase